MQTGQLFIISAPSGAGKTSLVKALCAQMDDIQPSVSVTTRAQREGEIDGQDYHFITEDEFEERKSEDDFLECARVFDYHYGTSEESVNNLLADGIDVVLEIDWQGARQIGKKLDNHHSIFVLPPSLKELENRLRKRGQDSKETIRRRMRAAVLEMVHYDEFDYLIINENFGRALDELKAIIVAQRCKTTIQQKEKRGLIKSLLA